MATETSYTRVARRIDSLMEFGSALGLTDRQLLERFGTERGHPAGAAFGVLVERHGPMVLSICRRILGNRHDAEDAAQATFMVLARQARSIRQHDSVASWLCGVAIRVASRSRLDCARRRERERRGGERSQAIRALDSARESGEEAWPELYEEIARLPDRYRLPIYFCYLEGLSQEQAAGRMGCPVRTIQSRLIRGKARLRERLTRRGAAPMLAMLAARDSSMAVASTWIEETVSAALSFSRIGAVREPISSAAATMARSTSRALQIRLLLNRGACAMLFFAVAAAGIGLGMGAKSPSPELKSANQAANERKTFAVNMGATIEVVGVSTVPSGPGTWWAPDGTRLNEPPVDTVESPFSKAAGGDIRVIVVRARDLPKDAYLRWLPSGATGYTGFTPKVGGQKAPGLEAYVFSFDGSRKTGAVDIRLASGQWQTEVTTNGRGGTGMFSHGHKFVFGKARSVVSNGRARSSIAVAHNFFEQDRRIVAVDKLGKEHPAESYSVGSDGDSKWVVDLIDAEFSLPVEDIREFRVQFRPFDRATIQGIALEPPAR